MDHLVTQGLQDLQGQVVSVQKEEILVHLDHRVFLVLLDRLVQMGLLEPLVLQGRRE